MSFATTIQSIETDVLNWVQGEEAKAAQWWKNFEPTLEADFTAFYTAVKPIALNLIVGIASAAISGPSKFAAVSAALLSVALQMGLKATITMANTVVQQIVASLGLNMPAIA